MTEPLKDLEELEAVKNVAANYLMPEPIRRDMFRLIATIELQKSDKALGAALVRKVQELKEEVESLLEPGQIISYKKAMGIAVSKCRELKEENTKLEAQLNESNKIFETQLTILKALR